MPDFERPAWFDGARVFYSRIDTGRDDPVRVFVPPDGDVTDENPGTLRLRLHPRGRALDVLDHRGCSDGVIRSEGLVRGVRYVMRRNDEPVWSLSVRSVVRKRHELRLTSGEVWMFDTPFCWWRGLTGAVRGAPRMIGRVGPRKKFWLFGVEAGCDTDDVLAAVAVLHRNWWRW